jgi:hypothetical protein
MSKISVVILAIVSTFAAAFIEQFVSGTARLYAAIGVIALPTALACWWVFLDARERGLSPRRFIYFTAFIVVLGLPYYLFRSRGFGGGLLALFLAICIFVLPDAAGSYFGEMSGAYAKAECGRNLSSGRDAGSTICNIHTWVTDRR